MQYLNHAISLYRESAKVKSLKVDYQLATDKNEKIAIKLSLLKLGYRVK